MIRRIGIANWRAYRRLDLDLTRPVTFIVAPNGVGKTSLVQAVMWGVFGELPSGGQGRLVRVGEEAAMVDLTIELPSGSTLDISRALRASGRSAFRCSSDGVEMSEQDYLRTLSEEWAADPHLLATLLFGEAGTQAESAFPIRDHLADVMGVAPLFEAVSTINDRSRALKSEIKSIRAEGIDSASIEAAEEETQQLKVLHSEARRRLTGAKAKAEELASVEQAADAWEQYRTQTEEYRTRSAELLDQLSAVVGVSEGDPEKQIARAEESARSELDRQRQAEAETRIQAAGAGSALELLADQLDTCPTCLRPLSNEERLRALEAHQTRGEDAGRSIHAFHQALEKAERRLGQVRELSQKLRAARMPTPPDVPEPSPEAVQQAALAEQQLLEATEAVGAAQARSSDAVSRLEALKQAAEEDAALVTAYREEAVLEIIRDAVSTVADRYMSQRIQPLTDEVSRRWKLLFGSEGLRLDPDGSLRFEIGADHLDLSDLSGGERVIALFVTRLLVVASATRATTLWLDEPLEHLDPRRRAVVARTIVKAAQQHALRQVVVTTYEERIAQQLALTAPDAVGVAHVRAVPAS
jgi:DNA repair exonuclease SbcCD ATPase subunit